MYKRQVYVDGMDTKDSGNTLSIRQTAGMVFQNPDNQIVGTLVDEEVGFGPCLLYTSPPKRRRV